MVEITSEEQNKVKRMKRTEDSLTDLWDKIKCTNIQIIGVPEEEEKKKGSEKIFEEIIVENFPNMEKEMATHSSGSCLENPRDGGAWWAPIYGVAQSRTRLKRLSSSSSSAFLVMQNIWGNPVPSSQFSCESESSLKRIMYVEKLRKAKQNANQSLLEKRINYRS